MFKGFLVLAILYLPGCLQLDRPFISPEHITNGVIEKQQEGMAIKVELSPRLSILGENHVFISLRDSEGLPIEDAHLNLSSTSTLPGMKIERVEIYHGPKGVYETPLHFISVGQWKMTLSIHRFGKKEMKNLFLFDVIGHA